MIRISEENYTYYFDKDNKPIATVSIGDKIIFETLDCWGNKLKNDEDLNDYNNMSVVNPTAGPVFIKGAEAGDILVIKILDIQCKNHGILALTPGEGVLRQYVKAPLVKIVSIENRKTLFNNNIVINNKPHIGTIGTTPLDKIATGFIGIHGGNIDCPEAGVGAKIYLPIFVEGALLQMGDVHASMGEGEICSSGVECSAEITIEILEVIKNKFIASPIIENENYWFILSNALSFEEAVRIGVKRMADFISKKMEISLEDATLLLGIVGNVRIAQSAGIDNFDISIFIQFPKYVDKSGRLNRF